MTNYSRRDFLVRSAGAAAGLLGAAGLTVARGIFRAHMDVASVDDGPVCILLDSKRTF